VRLIRRFALILAAALLPAAAFAGAQQYEPLAASVQAALHAAIADRAAPESQFPSVHEKVDWLTEMSGRLARRMPDREARSTSSRPFITKPSVPGSIRNGARPDPGGKRLQEIRGVLRRRPRLHAGHALLGAS
jgi:hypothetical protein